MSTEGRKCQQRLHKVVVKRSYKVCLSNKEWLITVLWPFPVSNNEPSAPIQLECMYTQITSFYSVLLHSAVSTARPVRSAVHIVDLLVCCVHLQFIKSSLDLISCSAAGKVSAEQRWMLDALITEIILLLWICLLLLASCKVILWNIFLWTLLFLLQFFTGLSSRLKNF